MPSALCRLRQRIHETFQDMQAISGMGNAGFRYEHFLDEVSRLSEGDASLCQAVRLYLQGFGREEIARRMRLTEWQVRQRLARGNRLAAANWQSLMRTVELHELVHAETARPGLTYSELEGFYIEVPVG